ncbi:hypothetical protein F5Y04DRAFT_247451 [Hypomontagnella monticulosa]|nr:hypothetical protein F5Y04DRAFT_247451 [Hypomontagnella monticulosa]
MDQGLPPRKSGLPGSTAPATLTPITGRVSRAKKGVVYTCDICKPPKTFTRQEHLRRHQLSHRNPAFRCTYTGCDKAFHRADLLARHAQRHEYDHVDATSSNLSFETVSSFPPTFIQYHDGRIPSSIPGYIPSLQIANRTSPPTITDIRQSPQSASILNSPHLYSPRQHGIETQGQYSRSASFDSGYVSPRIGLTPVANIPGTSPYPTPNWRQRGTSMSLDVENDIDLSNFLAITNHHELYVFKLAEELSVVLRQSTPLELAPPLPGLLDAFALRLGQCRHPIYQDLMHYISPRRRQITDLMFKAIVAEVGRNNQGDRQQDQGQMLLADKTSPLLEEVHDHGREDQSPPSPDANNNGIYNSAGFQKYRDIVHRSPAYKWFLNSVVTSVKLDISGTKDARAKIRQKILGNHELRNHMNHSMQFRAPWIAKFLEMQGYDAPSYEVLDHVIVLTGTSRHANATTCLQYVQSVWPDIGIHILSLHKSLLHQSLGSTLECMLFDGTRLIASTVSDGASYTVDMIGSLQSITEVIELLLWLGTSLSSLVVSQTITCQFPSCEVHQLHPDNASICWPTYDSIEILRAPVSSDSTGQCWANLFRDPVLVEGYPIPRRVDRDSGLEISLNLMAQLVNAKKVSQFSGCILIKGYSTILIPTKQHENFIFWHMVFNEDGDYISYSDSRVKELLKEYPENLTTNDLEISRHILGWCANVTNFTGSRTANYSIGWSGLRQPGSICAFDRVTIAGGMFLTGGISAAIGKRDKAVHIGSRDDYTMRLKWIAKQFVVLYDVRDRRAWLVDGASALLHLVRAPLRHDSIDIEAFRALFLYDESALQEAPLIDTGKEASINVLTNKDNLKLPIYAKPDSSKEEITINELGTSSRVLSSTKTNYCLKDRIEDTCEILEQIMAHQADVATENGVGFRIKCSARRQLEGFDFMDIATDESPLRPRAATLQGSGRGWVDFTRALHAITLFGTGFGELIQPIQEGATKCTSCYANVGVPKGQDFLAVCVSELQEILKKRGSNHTSPWRLVEDVYWHTPDQTFEPCQCAKSSTAKRDRVQVLLPAAFPKLWGRSLKSPCSLQSTPHGALLFGHSWRFPLRWNDRGVPEEYHINADLEEMEVSFNDSGIGSSQDPSSESAADGSTDSSPELEPSNEQQKRARDFTLLDDLLHMNKRRKLLSPISASTSSKSPSTTPDITGEEPRDTSSDRFSGSLSRPFARWKGKGKAI